MNISSTIFEAYLKCPTKCFLKAHGERGDGNVYTDWSISENEAYRSRESERLANEMKSGDCIRGLSSAAKLKTSTYCLALDVLARGGNLQAHLHAVEKVPADGKRRFAQFMPVHFIFRNKLTKEDKLLLAYESMVLSKMLGRAVKFGKIIHGDDHATLKVKTALLQSRLGKLIEKIELLISAEKAPDLMLNRHCGECEFQAICRQKAVEKNDLSLLSRMVEKERKKLNKKGIFTVTQLSYTFRPRRRPKKLRDKREKYHHSLRALAIREKKIYIIGSPKLKIEGTPIYFDVEGVPDRDFYYLIGLRVGDGPSAVHHSLWADSVEDEKRIWEEFLIILSGIKDPVLIHYGSFETVFLKRMMERYGKPLGSSFVAQAMEASINLLSIIFAQIYFSSVSNGLKDIAQTLGFRWTDAEASGLQSIVWRHQWQQEHSHQIMAKLIRYNAEDCEALGLVAKIIGQFAGPRLDKGSLEIGKTSVLQADSIVVQKASKWKKFTSSLPSLEHINVAAHWDYQRCRIYARSGNAPRKPPTPRFRQGNSGHVDKEVIWDVDPVCPRCGRHVRIKGVVRSRTLQDVIFGRFSLKRRIVTYIFQTYRCRKCGIIFGFPERYQICRKHGWGLIAYFLYQIIELRIPQRIAIQNFNRLLGYGIHRSTLNNIKTKAASYYAVTIKQILDRIIRGGLVHADETRANIKGKSAFVWVLTNLREVVYIYAESREGEVIQHLLAGFRGVLVTDFYTAYDSIECLQQKCLIHLIRDLNDEMLRNPFDEELKQIIGTFGELLKRIVETVDRYGLKKYFLRKHIVDVERFYRFLGHIDFQSEIAVKIQKRFERNRNKLFTFLEYDGVPWNNNNAEHAIKAFARLREVMGGSSTAKGTEEYLALLSICETCKYRGIDFLDFLRSGEKDIEKFEQSQHKKHRQY